MTKRDRVRAGILVYLPLRGTVMSLLRANAVLRGGEPYVLMTPADRQDRRSVRPRLRDGRLTPVPEHSVAVGEALHALQTS